MTLDDRIEIIDKIYNGAKINIIGDSIAAGIGSSDCVRTDYTIFTAKGHDYKRRIAPNSWWGLFADYLSDNFPKTTVINNGCGGVNSSQILSHIDSLINRDDDIIFLLFGCNDRKRKNGMDELYKNTKRIVDIIRAKKKKVILFTPTPSTEENENYENRIYHTDEVVRVLKTVAEEKNVMVVDNYYYVKHYLSSTSQVIDDIIFCEGGMNDGLHPGDVVQKLIYKNLMKALGLKVNLKVDASVEVKS